jgi:acyl homoserine lactone synthase
MYVIAGTPAELPVGFYPKVANYRHRVFVERLGWQLQSFDGAEQDQFDHDDTVYVVSKNEHSEITGCARLLPTTQPYLLGEVFPQLLNGLPPPNTPDVWELSRFASVDFNAKTATALNQFSSSVTIKLLKEAIACAAKRGAKRVITVSPVGIERLLKLSGLHAHRAGPPMIIDGHPIFACWIEIDGQ